MGPASSHAKRRLVGRQGAPEDDEQEGQSCEEAVQSHGHVQRVVTVLEFFMAASLVKES